MKPERTRIRGVVPRTHFTGIFVLAAAIELGMGVAAAQQTAPAPAKSQTPPGKPTSTNAQLRQEIEALRERIDVLQTAVVQRDSNIVLWQQALASVQAELTMAQQRLDELEQLVPSIEAARDMEKRLSVVEEEAKRTPELPPDVVSAGDFPGSIRIPRTDSAIKFSGRVRFAGVFTLGPLGSEDKFLTYSIPVEGSQEATKEARTNFNANASRFSVDLRAPTDVGQVRAYLEGDFAGSNNAFRLRHAFGQYSGLILGQTWSTFADPAIETHDLDFEGINSQNVIRQPQVRYSREVRAKLQCAVAAETPQVSITGGAGVNVVPDLVGRAIWQLSDVAHLQLGGILRVIRGQTVVPTDITQSEFAAGGGLSGIFPLRFGRFDDRIAFQINGGLGIARYINDLNGLGGQDAVFDSTGTLSALPVLGWYLNYQHIWKRWERARRMNVRSTFIWSRVRVFNLDIQPGDAYHRTDRFVANAILSPGAQVDVGVEYIYGTRFNKDGASGSSSQIQVVTLFYF